ncbi:MAG: hypothetical protein H2174_09870 [Vampirovibrio sp.]|nr:hypothetical protein [Vampirovibrio sp.]
MINPFALSPTASPFAFRPSAASPRDTMAPTNESWDGTSPLTPNGLAFNNNTANLYAPTSLAASNANSNAMFDYTNIAPSYTPSYMDKSSTNSLIDNSQANPTNNLQVKYVVKAPQKTNIYYDGQSNPINNTYYNTYYYLAAATPHPQSNYETPMGYPPTQGGNNYPADNYPPVGGAYGGGYPPISNGYGGGYPPQQPQDSNSLNVMLSILLPLLQQQKQEPDYSRTPDINLTIKNELKDLVNLVNENKNVAKADSEAVIEDNDTTNNDYDIDNDNRTYNDNETNNDYDNRTYTTTNHVTTPTHKKVAVKHPVKKPVHKPVHKKPVAKKH